MRITSSRRGLVVAAVVTTALVTLPLVAHAALSNGAARDSRRADHTEFFRQQVVGGQARNVIMLLGDGMGDSEITIARNYAVGAAGHLTMDSLPMTGEYTTYSVQKADPSLPD